MTKPSLHRISSAWKFSGLLIVCLLAFAAAGCPSTGGQEHPDVPHNSLDVPVQR